MASLVSSRPPSRSPSQTLSDIGIILPTLHLGSFSGMTLDPMPVPGVSLANETSTRSRGRPSSQSMSQRSHRLSTRGDEEVDMAVSNRSFLTPQPSISQRSSDSRPQFEEPSSEDNQQTLENPYSTVNVPRISMSSPIPSSKPSSSPYRNVEPQSATFDPVSLRDPTNTPYRNGTSTSQSYETLTNRNVEPQLKVVNGPGSRRIESLDYRYDSSNVTVAPGPRASISQYYQPAPLVNGVSSPSRTPVPEQVPQPLGSSPLPQQFPAKPEAPTPSPKGPVRPQIVQKIVAPEEVCVECMTRDQDMADVDVSSPGVWERESDVWYDELVRREVEEAKLGITPAENSNKPRAHGGWLTEGNLAVWLTLNPKEPAARWQTLEKYIKSQAEFLAAEFEAREQNLRESRLRDSKMRDAYFQLRRSTNDIERVNIPGEGEVSGIKLRASSGAERFDSRDVTLLESGMILERVDIRRQEKEERDRRKEEERAERRRTRKISRASVGGFASDASSLHSVNNPVQNVNYGSRSQISLSTPSVTGRRLSSPLTLSPPRPGITRGQSQSSNESRPRFFGFRHWSGAYGSEASLHHNSGSMMDMHLGLEQDRDQSGATYDEEPWTVSQLMDEPIVAPPPEEEPKDKKRSLGRFWKKMTRKDKDSSKSSRSHQPTHPQEDLSIPLDPPPPLSYLVSRSNGAERSTHSRHATSPSIQSSIGNGYHPRSASTPVSSPSLVPPLSTSASSTHFIPSPTSSASNRFSFRDSVISEDRRHSGPPDEVEMATDESSYERRDRSPRKSRGLYPPALSEIRRSTAPAASPSRTPRGGRQSSISSVDKALPPLPVDNFLSSRSQPSLRPVTSYDIMSMPPVAPFKTETRRQSFSGMITRPMSQTFNGMISRTRKFSDALTPPPLFGTVTVDEFGASTPSLGRWGNDSRRISFSRNPEKQERRRSRFSTGLSSLFGSGGRKSEERESALRGTALDGTGLAPNDGRIYPRTTERYPPTTRVSRSEIALRDSSASAVTFPRSSIASSRRYDNLIPQETDFIAFRYPTETERLDLVRSS